MVSNKIRDEFEKAYCTYLEALQKKDINLFMATVNLPDGFSEEDLREDFSEFAEFTLETTPDLSMTKFITIKTHGDELAGYYCTYTDPDDPKRINVMLTPFKKSGEGWKVMMSGGVFGFEPEEGEDIDSKITDLIENDSALQIRTDEDSMGMDCDMDISAILSCSAYDHNLDITINGVTLDYEGGSSFSQRLFGRKEGDKPSNPGLLNLGENEIKINFKQLGDDSPFPMTVEVMIPPAGHCFMLSTLKPGGEVNAKFVIPRSPTEDISPEEIECVNITDD